MNGSGTGTYKVNERVAEDAKKAAALLKDFVTPADGKEHHAHMQPGVIDSAQGFAFIHVTKGGFGLTLAKGTGFVVRKIFHEDGKTSHWSPPLYYTMSEFGAGLSIGAQGVWNVMALMTADSVKAFTHKSNSLGTDVVLFSTNDSRSGSAPTTIGKYRDMDITSNNHDVSIDYRVASGAMLDLFSLHRTSIHPDNHANYILYGDVSPEDILDGKVDNNFHEEMHVLHRALSALSQHNHMP